MKIFILRYRPQRNSSYVTLPELFGVLLVFGAFLNALNMTGMQRWACEQSFSRRGFIS